MADDNSNKAWLITIALTAGSFILALFKYLDDADTSVINKEIAIRKLQELREASAAKKATDAPADSSTSPAVPQTSSA